MEYYYYCSRFFLYKPISYGVADVPSDKNQIEVIISEKVDLEDFYEKYDIVEKRGNIWVLNEKYPQEEK